MTKKKAGALKYKPSYAKEAYKLCLLGYTDEDLANHFSVTERTINNWKKDFTTFFQSIMRGKGLADAEVAEALYRRATGYSHKAVKIFNNQGEIITEEFIQHYPPDTQAASLWLRNRQPKKWRDKPEIEDEGNDPNAPVIFNINVGKDNNGDRGGSSD